MARILIVDDDRSFRESLGETIASIGHEPLFAGDGDAALALLATRSVALALVDLRMPGRDGLDVLRAIRADPHLATMPVVLLTAHADADNTIDAMRLGAFDHLTKPVGRADVIDLVERALPQGRAPTAKRAPSNADADDGRLIGSSAGMRAVHKLVGIAASSDATVLIQGETGTGKELVARAIHAHGDRAAKPFVAINCAAIPADLLESELFGHERGAFSGATHTRAGRLREADGGTLFLDEIGDMSIAMQAKLLRVLQDRLVVPVGGSTSVRVDVRIVCATHRDLVAMVADGRFREDLYYRINVLRIDLPPLRARGSDILVLAERMIERFATTPKQLAPDAAKALLDHRWPGNVRELENLMRKVVLTARGGTIARDDLGLVASAEAIDDDGAGLDFATAVGRFETKLLERALADCDGNRSAAARRLGMRRQLLYAKLKEHGIE